MRVVLRRQIYAGLVGVALIGWGCGNGEVTDPPQVGDAVVRLTAGLQFSPAQVMIERGQTVEWRNDVTMLHTITPDGHGEWPEATLSVSGETFTHTFEEAGTFPYHCVPHLGDGMTGVIVVQ
jgi:plastocyanin